MKRIIAYLLMAVSGFSVYCQDNPETRLNSRIDSIYRLLDPNAADFEEKAAEMMGDFAKGLQNFEYYDTAYVMGMEIAEMIASEVEMLIYEENDSSYLSSEFTESMPCLFIDLGKSYNRFAIEDAGSFQNLQVLVIRGNMKPSSFDVTNLFLLIESLPVRELYIINCAEGVTNIPENIGSITTLRKLALFGNNITSLPESICQLTSLEELYVDANPITRMPGDIGKLTNLKILGIAGTQLSNLEVNRVKNLIPQCNLLTQ